MQGLSKISSFQHTEDTLDCLNGAVWLTTLDMKFGYWQVEMDKASKPLTAFTIGPLGFNEHNRMPFGLTNTHVTFQRLIETCLGILQLNWYLIYLDDITVLSRTPKDPLVHLQEVYQKSKEAGFKLKPNKCEVYVSHWLNWVIIFLSIV